MENIRDWYDLYVERMNDGYREHLRNYYAPFLSYIKQISEKSNIIVEAGCGAGNITRLIIETLSNIESKKFHLWDNHPKMLQLASENMFQVRKYKMKEYYRASTDMVDLLDQTNALTLIDTFDGNIDLIHSHGVLEHFNDEDIQKILLEQKTFSNNVIHYVPGEKYKVPSRGDERLLSTEEWYKITEAKDIIEFNEGKDLILVIK